MPQHDGLLERRIAREQIVVGRAYVIHARNGGIGVAAEVDGRLGYRLHREKIGEHRLSIEWDWSNGEPHGTAIPLRLLDAMPPQDDAALLEWLAALEEEHRDEIAAAWDVVLGPVARCHREHVALSELRDTAERTGIDITIAEADMDARKITATMDANALVRFVDALVELYGWIPLRREQYRGSEMLGSSRGPVVVDDGVVHLRAAGINGPFVELLAE